ncbi:MAG TPA: NAD-dependent epimerase/dehydratase family protein [Aquihabitans sp.]|jgi:nucleoside-diphosphate-sugar epimerase|nr:NAD-dependent epimerase/dehydratase family protein [Aquihabitans sp.]
MIAIVTGAAGFIGSTLCRRLLADGHTVIGIDCLTKTYDLRFKTHNVDGLVDNPRFQLVYSDLAEHPPGGLVQDADVVFHLAGQASVTRSWGGSFTEYARNNIEATQRLLEACVDRGLQRFVYASSSSVYGDAMVLPTPETCLPRPISPYGVSKLAGEHLCHAYQRERGLPVTSLRFFTVYGPGQRPDMAFHRLLRSVYAGDPFPLRGDGTATRDFTYVDDVVDALVRAAGAGWDGVLNVGGGHRVSMAEVIDLVEDVAGPVDVQRGPTVAGDARDTSADTSLARDVLGWQPQVALRDGIEAMSVWATDLLRPEAELSVP